MLTAVIIDDIEQAIVLLRNQLKKYCPEVTIVGQAEDVADGIRVIEQHHPHLVFLDIGLAEETGFDLLERVQVRNFHVVFVTAHSEFAIRAFQFSVTDYLLKPVNRDLLKQAVQKVKNLVDGPAPFSSMPTLRVPTNKGVVFVPILNIIRMEAEGSYTHIYLDAGKYYMCSHYLKQFEEHLDETRFLRIHRSHIINRGKIKSIIDKQGLLIEMTDGAVIEVPRRSKREIQQLLHLKK